jgi:predicted phosphodiesterase
VNLIEALAAPPPPERPSREPVAVPKVGDPGTYEWDGNEGIINTPAVTERITTWDDYLRDAGLDPEEVEVVEPVGVRGWDAIKKVWDEDRQDFVGEIVRMHYYRLQVRSRRAGPSIDELLQFIDNYKPEPTSFVDGDSTFVVALGDFQFGKSDGDGVEGTFSRVVACLHAAVDRLKAVRRLGNVGKVHIAFMGDNCEGFVSQNGANAWRTTLTLTEQIRLVRRVMLLAVQLFAPLVSELTVVAVPGNHDQAVRFGNGITRYDDSHDTEALHAVMDACRLVGERFAHVQFYTPQRDDLSVTTETSGTVLSHIHGHQARKGRHFEWWAGQSLGDLVVGEADVLLSGHYHHFVFDTSGKRKFIQVPALESESTWYKLRTGVVGDPGVLTFTTKDGDVANLSVVRG